MKRSTQRTSYGKIASVLLMVLALLWLSVSTPFVYASQQSKVVKSAAATNSDADDSAPLSNTNEEKSETGVNTLSEYLHDTHTEGYTSAPVIQYHKCHPSDLYFAFHPELLSPPPERTA